MGPYSTSNMFKTIVKRFLRVPFNWIPEGATKFKIRAFLARRLGSVPNEFLVGVGETVLLLGVHRIDTVMAWSWLVGPRGKVIVVEAVPDYIDNIRRNLEHHLNWSLDNVVYVAKGVDAVSGRKAIEIGERADFNKLANQAIDDGLSSADFIREVEIDLDTVDHILEEVGIHHVDYIYITISGMEAEALKGMQKTLQMKGMRLKIRSLHMRHDEPLYLEVKNILQDAGLVTALSRKPRKFKGRDIYACRV